MDFVIFVACADDEGEMAKVFYMPFSVIRRETTRLVPALKALLAVRH